MLPNTDDNGSTTNNAENEERRDQSRTAPNAESQGVDKAPGEDRGKEANVTPTDLKGKKVDGDPSKEEDQPARQK